MRNKRGFTLVEILIVIGIVVLLAGVLLPVVGKAWRSAKKTRTAADMNAIATGIAAYKLEHGDIPRVQMVVNRAMPGQPPPPPFLSTPDRPNPRTGAQILCQALLALGPAGEQTPPANHHHKEDGKDGSGFAYRQATLDSSGEWIQQGKGYGPYLSVESFETGYQGAEGEVLLQVIVDSNGQPILYFPRRSGPVNLTAYIGRSTNDVELSTWDMTDNFEPFRRGGESDAAVEDRIAAAFGDTDGDGDIQSPEKASHEGEYVLWAAGSDEVFGTEDDITVNP